MTNFSSVPVLATVLGVFWVVATTRSATRGTLQAGEFVTLILWVVAMTGWGLLSGKYAITGDYRTDAFLQSLPGFWLPFIPVGVTVVLLAVPGFRTGLFKLFVDNERAFIFAQGLRALAIGGVIKGLTGRLPPSFALPIGIPDFLFGLSALWLGVHMARRQYSEKALIVWNLAGMVVILPAPFLMQMGMPGPLYTFTSQPDTRTLLEFPLALAPTLIVPVFITLNFIHAAVLWRRSQAMSAQNGLPERTTAR